MEVTDNYTVTDDVRDQEKDWLYEGSTPKNVRNQAEEEKSCSQVAQPLQWI